MLVESLLLVQSPFPAARAPMGLDKNLLRHIFRACASNQPLNPIYFDVSRRGLQIYIYIYIYVAQRLVVPPARERWPQPMLSQAFAVPALGFRMRCA